MMLKDSETELMQPVELCDAEVQEALYQRLLSSGHCGLRCIRVQVESQSIVLSGAVGTYYLKQIAQESARAVCPERQVQNQITVSETHSGVSPPDQEDRSLQKSSR